MKHKESRKIRVLLVDDHPIVLQGLKSHLSAIEQILIVGEAADGREAVEKARRLAPDVVLMDISLPRMNGLDAARALQEQVPQARIIALSMHGNKEYVQEMIRCGARGYILKTASPFDLVRAIETVHRGDTFFSAEVSQALLNDYVHKRRRGGETGETRLSAREEEVLLLIAEGLTNKEISQRLFISVRTVETHRERMMHKLDIHTASGLTRYALESGLAESRLRENQPQGIPQPLLPVKET